MKHQVVSTLEKLYAELTIPDSDGSPTMAAFHLVDQLIAEWGESGIAGKVVDLTPEGTPTDLMARALSMMQWSTSDNGHGISAEAERWLVDAEDPLRVHVALNLDFFPFATREEMEEALLKVAKRFPDLRTNCERLVESRKRKK